MQRKWRRVWKRDKSTNGDTSLAIQACQSDFTFNYLLKNMLPLVAAAGFLLTTMASVQACPAGGQVITGSGTIATNGATTTVMQQTNKMGINWQSFNVAANEKVHFDQPSANAVVLNRVIGNDASQIFGQINANGKVFLINPNGVLFAPGSQVNVGSIVASTLNISDSDFKAGNYKFSGSTGTVTNKGNITASNGGYVALLAPEVINEGVIVAQKGTVALGAGSAVTLDFSSGLISMVVDEASVKASVANKSLIEADGGQVIIGVKAFGDLVGTVINNSGIIKATSISNINGVITLDGGTCGVVENSGALESSGKKSAQTGGMVKVLGDKVGLTDSAKIDVSGDNGGGTVLVGGNFQGTGSEQKASATYVGSQATINADAITKGNGGQVVVWSDNITRYNGTISAKGGVQGGNGGSVETSGKNILAVRGKVDASAANGKAGTWLLDPHNVSIENTDTGDSVNPSVTYAASADDAVVTKSSIESALNNGTSVTITTGSDGTQAGDITVNVAIEKTSGSDATLKLSAAHDITVNQSISSSSSKLNVELQSGNSVTLNGDISANNGNVSVNAPALNLGANITGNTVNLIASTSDEQTGGGITATNLVLSGAGNHTLTNRENAIKTLSSTGTGAVSLVNATNLSVSGLIATGAVDISSSDGAITIAGAVNAGSSAVTLSAGRGLALNANITGGTVSLMASGTASQASDKGISASSLVVGGDGSQYILSGAANAISAVSTSDQVGAIKLVNAADVTVNDLTATTGNIDFSTTGAKSITVSGTLDAGSNTISLNAAKDITLKSDLTGGTVKLTAGGIDTQNSGSITAPRLVLGAGSHNLSSQGNKIAAVSGSGKVGAVTLVNGKELTVNALTSSGAVNIISTGGITVNQAVTAENSVSLNAANLTLAADIAGAAVNLTTDGEDSATGKITAATLVLSGAGIHTVSSSTNLIDAVSGTVGSLTLVNAKDLMANSLTASSGDLTITAAGKNITVNGALSAAGNVIKLNSGKITLAAALQAGTADFIAETGITLKNNVTTSGAQRYTGAITLGSDAVLKATSADSGDITINNNAALNGKTLSLAAGHRLILGDGAVLDTTTAGGKWLVYVPNASSYSGSDIVANYKFSQYGTSYGGTIQGTGNGLIYAEKVNLTPALVGDKVSRTYNGGTAVTNLKPENYQVNGLKSDWTLASISTETTGQYEKADVGTSIKVTADSDPTLTIKDANQKAVYGYTFTAKASGTIGEITPATITVSNFGGYRTYGDGNDKIYYTNTLNGIFNNDDVYVIGTLNDSSITQGSNATTYKNVIGSTGLSGSKAGNYTLTNALIGDLVINKSALTITATANTKTYDGGVSAAADPTITGLKLNQTASATETYADKNAGTDKVLKVIDYTINDGNGGNNYSVTVVDNKQGKIAQATLTITANAISKTYDATTASAAAATISGLQTGDTASAIEAYSDKNVGKGKTLTVTDYVVNDGNGGNNYIVTKVDNKEGVINTASLTITAAPNTKQFDGDATSKAVPIVTGKQGTDEVIATEVYADSSIGTKKNLHVNTVAINDGNNGNNYAVTTIDSDEGTITEIPVDYRLVANVVGSVDRTINNTIQNLGDSRYIVVNAKQDKDWLITIDKDLLNIVPSSKDKKDSDKDKDLSSTPVPIDTQSDRSVPGTTKRR